MRPGHDSHRIMEGPRAARARYSVSSGLLRSLRLVLRAWPPLRCGGGGTACHSDNEGDCGYIEAGCEDRRAETEMIVSGTASHIFARRGTTMAQPWHNHGITMAQRKCSEPDSNRHSVIPKRILSPSRLPISPSERSRANARDMVQQYTSALVTESRPSPSRDSKHCNCVPYGVGD